jgi:hypothetical protein
MSGLGRRRAPTRRMQWLDKALAGRRGRLPTRLVAFIRAVSGREPLTLSVMLGSLL